MARKVARRWGTTPRGSRKFTRRRNPPRIENLDQARDRYQKLAFVADPSRNASPNEQRMAQAAMDRLKAEWPGCETPAKKMSYGFSSQGPGATRACRFSAGDRVIHKDDKNLQDPSVYVVLYVKQIHFLGMIVYDIKVYAEGDPDIVTWLPEEQLEKAPPRTARPEPRFKPNNAVTASNGIVYKVLSSSPRPGGTYTYNLVDIFGQHRNHVPEESLQPATREELERAKAELREKRRADKEREEQEAEERRAREQRLAEAMRKAQEDARKTTEDRPKPRFKVGDEVVYNGQVGVVHEVHWSGFFSEWKYDVWLHASKTRRTLLERHLGNKAKAKFKIGDRVIVIGGSGSSRTIRDARHTLAGWEYDIGIDIEPWYPERDLAPAPPGAKRAYSEVHSPPPPPPRTSPPSSSSAQAKYEETYKGSDPRAQEMRDRLVKQYPVGSYVVYLQDRKVYQVVHAGFQSDGAFRLTLSQVNGDRFIENVPPSLVYKANEKKVAQAKAGGRKNPRRSRR